MGAVKSHSSDMLLFVSGDGLRRVRRDAGPEMGRRIGMLAGAPSDPSMIDPAGTEGQPCGRTHRVGSKGMVPWKEAFSRVSKKADTHKGQN